MRIVKLLHKWLGLIVGLQLLLWTTSGLMFSWLNHHDVQGEHSTRDPPRPKLEAADPLIEPATWLGEYANASIRDIRLVALLEHWVYRIELADRVELRRAADGKRFTIDESLVRQLARAHFAAGDELSPVIHPAEHSLEARGEGAVWRADFADAGHTSLYFAAADGRLVERRNRSWRVFDFFWMLHTMDYRGRDNFNNPVVILFATGALWLAITGALLLSLSFQWTDLNPFNRQRTMKQGVPPEAPRTSG